MSLSASRVITIIDRGRVAGMNGVRDAAHRTGRIAPTTTTPPKLARFYVFRAPGETPAATCPA
jgi:hypothetical protein